MSDNVETARRVIASAATTLQPGQDAGAHYARALAEAGLLADPAQTTELERLRERVTLNQQLNADSQRVARKARAERDERQARIDAALEIVDEPAPRQSRTDPHFERMNARDARTQLVQRVRAALVGDQPTTEGLKRQPLRRKHALPRLAEGATRELGIALPGEEEYEEVADVSFRREEDWREVDAKIIRNAEERDDAAGDQR